ncbi:hypothetical protein [Kineosporia babensis]|uniref:Uncharacterized protein n=1 Tax=Kineosporia babensis TaxID=499548 RepID=A0A9X1NCP4_9ACTN|nr:hypothetical protein [Kineosporia babensis]MCD5310836.1 hypothetical protein [Kineosporia babensis]
MIGVLLGLLVLAGWARWSWLTMRRLNRLESALMVLADRTDTAAEIVHRWERSGLVPEKEAARLIR